METCFDCGWFHAHYTNYPQIHTFDAYYCRNKERHLSPTKICAQDPACKHFDTEKHPMPVRKWCLRCEQVFDESELVDRLCPSCVETKANN